MRHKLSCIFGRSQTYIDVALVIADIASISSLSLFVIKKAVLLAC